MGWTSKLALFLWKETKLSCKFDLKVAYVTQDEQIKVSASCDCGGFLEVLCDGNVLSVNIRNMKKNFKHKRRYQATGELRQILNDELKHNSALKVQTKQTNELIPDNENLKTDFVPVMQTLNAKRIIKCLEKRTGEVPVDVLLNWKDSIYKNVISLVAHSPFTVHYRTSLQIAWYTQWIDEIIKQVPIVTTGEH